MGKVYCGRDLTTGSSRGYISGDGNILLSLASKTETVIVLIVGRETRGTS